MTPNSPPHIARRSCLSGSIGGAAGSVTVTPPENGVRGQHARPGASSQGIVPLPLQTCAAAGCLSSGVRHPKGTGGIRTCPSQPLWSRKAETRMPKVIDARTHGIIDYGHAAFFLGMAVSGGRRTRGCCGRIGHRRLRAGAVAADRLSAGRGQNRSLRACMGRWMPRLPHRPLPCRSCSDSPGPPRQQYLRLTGSSRARWSA